MTSALPEGFVRMLGELGLEDAADAIVSTAPSVSVRLNPRKAPVSFPGGSPVPWWAGQGVILPERPSFTLDPALHQGRYYVQEAGSMFHARIISSLVEQTGGRPLRVLDACAAPGGKTTAAIDALPDGSVVVANEYVPARAAVLRENLHKWGFPGVIVTRGSTAPFSRLREEFDVILADVPCSGEGMMRKDPEAVSQWSPGLIEECASLQRSILDDLWPALRPGGFLVYSTCTFNRRENEEQMLGFMPDTGAESLQLPLESLPGVTGAISAPGLHAARFIPGRTPTEGLFVTLLRKPGSPLTSSPTPRSEKRMKTPAEAQTAASWISSPEEMKIFVAADRITALPSAAAPLLSRLEKLTDVIAEGLTIATIKGRDIIPSQQLALSTIYRRGAFPEHPVSRDEAVDYLRGSALTITDAPKGFVLLTYGDAPLGWVKNLGSRSNNLYPHPWRIKFK